MKIALIIIGCATLVAGFYVNEAHIGGPLPVFLGYFAGAFISVARRA